MTAHWGVPDPARAEGTEAEKRLAFADAYRMLNNRISIFVSLPLASLDRLSLQKRLDRIGKTKGRMSAAILQKGKNNDTYRTSGGRALKPGPP